MTFFTIFEPLPKIQFKFVSSIFKHQKNGIILILTHLPLLKLISIWLSQSWVYFQRQIIMYTHELSKLPEWKAYHRLSNTRSFSRIPRVNVNSYFKGVWSLLDHPGINKLTKIEQWGKLDPPFQLYFISQFSITLLWISFDRTRL